MVMDPSFQRFSDAANGFRFNAASLLNKNVVNGFSSEETSLLDHNHIDLPHVPPDSNQNIHIQSSNESVSVDTPENECPDFSDTVLKYINQMLMEEDMEEKSCMIQESSAAIQAAERPFYEILGKRYPPSPNHHPLDDTIDSWLDYPTSNSSTSSSGNPSDSNWLSDVGEYKSPQFPNFPIDYTLQSTPQSSFNPSNGINYVLDGMPDSPPWNKTINVPDMYCEHEPQWHFRKGVEEASKFLPSGANLFVSLERNASVRKGSIRERTPMVVKEEKKDDKEDSPNGSRGKKNLHRIDIDLEEGRSTKHSAVSVDEPLRTEMFDRILLCADDKRSIDEHVANLQETLKGLKTEESKNREQNVQSKASNGGKSRGRKQSAKKDVVDLRTLLIHCAQAVAGDDRRSTTELLKQIRQHSSPSGDGNQRVAHYFANALEARLTGTGTRSHSTCLTLKTSAADILKAYQLYLAACPFKKISNFFANQSIMNLTGNATETLHIVDFGIAYGFQWPCLIQRLSARPGGPPKLRITGIELPQPGFKPAERVEETGRRLANYAQSFNVPFEFNAIAKKWETIKVEDIKVEPGELLVVNCIYRFKNLLDETVVLDSPRNTVLKLIRKINPSLFIHGVVNGSYNAPFFTTRFREALFHYSSMFDMLETNVPREHPERLVIERDLFGYEALNVIACEGSERTERPETYKQWQIRNMRAGFQQLPLQQECMNKAKDRVKTSYHKDFVIDQDGQWMLQGWKGRIIFGISCWRPVHDS